MHRCSSTSVFAVPCILYIHHTLVLPHSVTLTLLTAALAFLLQFYCGVIPKTFNIYRDIIHIYARARNPKLPGRQAGKAGKGGRERSKTARRREGPCPQMHPSIHLCTHAPHAPCPLYMPTRCRLTQQTAEAKSSDLIADRTAAHSLRQGCMIVSLSHISIYLCVLHLHMLEKHRVGETQEI
jgi:hypothetical protein